MDAVGLSQVSNHNQLVDKFWLRGGPNWDALARLHLPDGEVAALLVEAKSHRLELCSCCSASKPSKELIKRAFERAQVEWLKPRGERTWLSPVYQYVNHLAHLFFLRHVLGVKAWLVYVYFLNGRHRPTTREQWLDFLPDVNAELRLSNRVVPFSADVFLDAHNGLD